MEAELPKVLPESPIGEAIRHALNHWSAVRLLESRFGDRQNTRIRVVQRPNSTFPACHRGKRVAEDFYHGLRGGMHLCHFHYEICP
jgi:hypothetical protein